MGAEESGLELMMACVSLTGREGGLLRRGWELMGG